MIRFQVLTKSPAQYGGTVLTLGFGAECGSRVTFLASDADAKSFDVGEWYGLSEGPCDEPPATASAAEPCKADPGPQAADTEVARVA